MPTDLYYHKFIPTTRYYLDGLYFSWAMPLNDIKYTSYDTELPNAYIPRTKHIEANPLAFSSSFIKKTVQLITDHLWQLQSNQANNNYFNYIGGIRLHADLIHHNILIYFDGKFFQEKNIKLELPRLWRGYLYISEWIGYYFRTTPEWKEIRIPQLKVSQLHIAESLPHKNFPNGWKDFKIIASEKAKRAMRLKNKPAKDFYFPSLKNIDTPPIRTGVSAGTTGSCVVSVYDKFLDPQKQHAILRFKTDRFYRREYKLYSRKLSSVISKNRYFHELYNLLKQPSGINKIVKSARRTVDIQLKDDDLSNTIFHEYNPKIKSKFTMLIKRQLTLNYDYENSKVNPHTISKKDIESFHWNPFKTIKGIGLSKHCKNMSTEEIITLITLFSEIARKDIDPLALDPYEPGNQPLLKLKEDIRNFKKRIYPPGFNTK